GGIDLRPYPVARAHHEAALVGVQAQPGLGHVAGQARSAQGGGGLAVHGEGRVGQDVVAVAAGDGPLPVVTGAAGPGGAVDGHQVVGIGEGLGDDGGGGAADVDLAVAVLGLAVGVAAVAVEVTGRADVVAEGELGAPALAVPLGANQLAVGLDAAD